MKLSKFVLWIMVMFITSTSFGRVITLDDLFSLDSRAITVSGVTFKELVTGRYNSTIKLNIGMTTGGEQKFLEMFNEFGMIEFYGLNPAGNFGDGPDNGKIETMEYQWSLGLIFIERGSSTVISRKISTGLDIDDCYFEVSVTATREMTEHEFEHIIKYSDVKIVYHSREYQ